MEDQDWQTSRKCLNKRGEHLLASGKWADCEFLLGQENQEKISIPCHKLILAMASPVFEAMFYGELAEKNGKAIPILDIRPDAFRALLVYIYTDKIEVDSVDKACDLCYASKKYMLWHVVETCTNYIFNDLRPKNVCRALEFARLFEEPRLMKNCMAIICHRTMEVLEDPSFEEADVNTVLMIVDQNVLNINSELCLFRAISRYAEKQQLTLDSSGPSSSQESDKPVASCSSSSSPPQSAPESDSKEKTQMAKVLRCALKKVRFLTLTPQEFAECPAQSKLLTQTEAFHILMNISSTSAAMPMPDGFTDTREHRTIGSFEFRATAPLNRGPHDIFELFDIPPSSSSTSSSVSSVIVPTCNVAPQSVEEIPGSSNDNSPGPVEVMEPVAANNHVSRRYYCHRFLRTQTDCLNTSILDCCLTFSVDRSICITGCQVPTQVLGGMNLPPAQDGNFPERYSELLYAHLLDSLGSRLTYTHCTSRVHFDASLEITFDRPVYVQKEKTYKIGVVFNKVGWYPMALCLPSICCNNVNFTFSVGSSNESVRDGLIRAIVFKFPNEM